MPLIDFSCKFLSKVHKIVNALCRNPAQLNRAHYEHRPKVSSICLSANQGRGVGLPLQELHVTYSPARHSPYYSPGSRNFPKASLLGLSTIHRRWSNIAQLCTREAPTVLRMEEPEFLTRDQFIALLIVGEARPNSPAPIIPADHEIFLSGLGYVVNLNGRLRLTTPGRMRLVSVEKYRLNKNCPNLRPTYTSG